ncbi:MAG: arsenate reductase (azurin) small subunit [Pseudomonadota bacterium]
MKKNKKQSGTEINRRQMLSLGAAAGLAAGIVPDRAAAAETSATYPKVSIAPLAELEPGAQIDFDYPDEDSPAILLRLDGPVEGGIGPGESIVAFSALCTHKGCPVAYNSEHKMLICPCHWSSFDPAKQGQMIIGQGSENLPRITLRVENGTVEAVGVEGLIYGRLTNIL